MASLRCNPKNLYRFMSSPRRMCLPATLLLAVGFVVLGPSLHAQNSSNPGAGTPAVDPVVQRNIDEWVLQGKGVPEDWSHRHLVFSNPGTREDAVKNGTFEHWLKVTSNSRFTLQQVKRGGSATMLEAQGLEASEVDSSFEATTSGPGTFGPGKNKKKKKKKSGLWTMDMGSGATVGAGNYPAKYSFSSTAASCSTDFVAYNTSLLEGTGTASIIAFSNIYSGCSGTVPSVFWSYNTGGQIASSAVLSITGTQLVFVHSSASGSSLVILKWKSGEGSGAGSGSAGASPVTPTTQTGTASTYVTCRGGATSCQLTLPFSGSAANVTHSSPFYDYDTDVLYVGDDGGVLHKFTGVFTGSPGEVTTGGWPLTVHSGSILTAPVLDLNTENIFVGDASGRLSYVREGGSTTGTCGSGNPPCLGSTSVTLAGPIADAPLIDSSTAEVLAFSGTTSAASYEVLQTTEAIPASGNASITFAGTGTGFTSNMRAGTFDNLYFTSGPATGHLYVCGPHSSTSNDPTLYQISFTSSAGVINTTASGSLDMVSASLAAGTIDDCSPLTEFYNGTTDYLFGGVTQNGKLTGCTGSGTVGCLYNFDITNGTMPVNSVAGLTSNGGTTGIVIDNNGPTIPSGGAQVYFTNLTDQGCTGNSTTGNGTGGCATQASQGSLN